MSAMPPFIISFLIGYFLIDVICLHEKKIGFFLHSFLALGLGLGISATLTFLSFCFFQKSGVFVAIFTNFICLAVLSLWSVNNIKKTLFKNSEKRNFLNQGANLFIFFFFIMLIWNIYKIAVYHNPYGGWDAWALYDMKARFLFLGGAHWKNLFALHWHTQPSYPLLLSSIYTLAWGMIGTNSFQAPVITAVMFTVSCCGLLFSGVARYSNIGLGFIFLILLLTTPFFIIHGLSQYADIVVAYYLLASVITIIISLRESRKDFAFLSGLFLGFLSFTKNEGIIMMSILVVITSVYLFSKRFSDKRSKKIFIPLLIGSCFCLLTTGIFKTFFAPPNSDIVPFSLKTTYQFLNIDGIVLITRSMIEEVVSYKWGNVWFVIFFILLISFHKVFYKEAAVLTCFFIFYFTALFMVYLTTINFDLSWRLSRTLSRIFHYLLPSALFFTYYLFNIKIFFLKKDNRRRIKTPGRF